MIDISSMSLSQISNLDLIVDEVYGGSRLANASDDPLPQLLGVDSGAGFRHLGPRPNTGTLKLLVLKSSLRESDWPDSLDIESGIFTYFGDRRSPGGLHDTKRQGNQILRNLFDYCHSSPNQDSFPPILIFGNTGTYRDVKFFGLAVPGAETLNADEDLVALWRSTGNDNTRFQNYRAKFTILDIPVISRAWIRDIQAGKGLSSHHAPASWLDWINHRKYRPLRAPHVSETRTKEQQLPISLSDQKLLGSIHQHYENDSYGFEKCALEIARLMMPAISDAELTRPWRDGGRDATGYYTIGTGKSAIQVEFALEAKCFGPKNSVGVKHTSRLISRLRHRQFGILVTTSYLHHQAYREIADDGHPIVVISGTDIVHILKQRFGSGPAVQDWLSSLA